MITIFLTPRARDRIEKLTELIETAAGTQLILGHGDWISLETKDEWRARRAMMVIGRGVIEVVEGI